MFDASCLHFFGPSISACRSLCTGKVAGSRYSILVPKTWNGTLLLYSHGYQYVSGSPVAALSGADLTGRGTDPVSQVLLSQGYALAGSAYPRTGWVVPAALDADVALHERFVSLVGRPDNVIAWGSSMGGLITELLAERETWVDAAAPMCGVLAGVVAQHRQPGARARTRGSYRRGRRDCAGDVGRH